MLSDEERERDEELDDCESTLSSLSVPLSCGEPGRDVLPVGESERDGEPIGDGERELARDSNSERESAVGGAAVPIAPRAVAVSVATLTPAVGTCEGGSGAALELVVVTAAETNPPDSDRWWCCGLVCVCAVGAVVVDVEGAKAPAAVEDVVDVVNGASVTADVIVDADVLISPPPLAATEVATEATKPLVAAAGTEAVDTKPNGTGNGWGSRNVVCGDNARNGQSAVSSKLW